MIWEMRVGIGKRIGELVNEVMIFRYLWDI